MICFPCPECHRPLKADPSAAGRLLPCPDCAGDVEVPRPGPEGEDETERVEFVHGEEELLDHVDMTPMIDCVFQLLIFFMVTATYTQQASLKMPPPDKQESATQARTLEELEQDDDYVIIRIGRDDTVWVDEQEAPSRQEVLAKLREAREGPPGSTSPGPTSLLVLADGEARHETVVMALDAGNAVGMEDIRLATVDEEDL